MLGSLTLTVAGVTLSSLGDTDFNMGGFIFAALSNVMFSTRSVFTKVLNRRHPTTGFSGPILFYHVSCLGLVLLVPLVLVTDGSKLVALREHLLEGERMSLCHVCLVMLANGCFCKCTCFKESNSISCLHVCMYALIPTNPHIVV
jgi:hypothetical protein